MAEGKKSVFDTLEVSLEWGEHAWTFIRRGRKGVGHWRWHGGTLIHRLRRQYLAVVREQVARTVSDPAEIEGEIRALCDALIAAEEGWCRENRVRNKPGEECNRAPGLVEQEVRICAFCGTKFFTTADNRFCPVCILRGAVGGEPAATEEPGLVQYPALWRRRSSVSHLRIMN